VEGIGLTGVQTLGTGPGSTLLRYSSRDVDKRIAAALITGDGPEKEDFERLFSSLAAVGVNWIFVSYSKR